MSRVSPAELRSQAELVPRFRVEAGDYAVALDVSRDGCFCAVGLGDGTLLGVDLESGAQRFRSLAHAGGVLSVSIAPDGKSVATSGQDGTAKIWRDSGEPLRTLA